MGELETEETEEGESGKKEEGGRRKEELGEGKGKE